MAVRLLVAYSSSCFLSCRRMPKRKFVGIDKHDPKPVPTALPSTYEKPPPSQPTVADTLLQVWRGLLQTSFHCRILFAFIAEDRHVLASGDRFGQIFSAANRSVTLAPVTKTPESPLIPLARHDYYAGAARY